MYTYYHVNFRGGGRRYFWDTWYSRMSCRSHISKVRFNTCVLDERIAILHFVVYANQAFKRWTPPLPEMKAFSWILAVRKSILYKDDASLCILCTHLNQFYDQQHHCRKWEPSIYYLLHATCLFLDRPLFIHIKGWKIFKTYWHLWKVPKFNGSRSAIYLYLPPKLQEKWDFFNHFCFNCLGKYLKVLKMIFTVLVLYLIQFTLNH